MKEDDKLGNSLEKLFADINKEQEEIKTFNSNEIEEEGNN